MVRRIPEEASRRIGLKILTTTLLGITGFLALAIGIDKPAQIVHTPGIVWGVSSGAQCLSPSAT